MGQGAAGEMGRTGPIGPKGDQGPIGPAGPKGQDAIIQWGALTDAQKTEIKDGLKAFAELRGPPGPPGPKGESGDVEWSALDETQKKALASILVTNYKTELKGERGLQGPQGIQGSTGPKGDQGTQGPAGTLGSDASMKQTLFTEKRTMWCADGDFCEVPESKKGIVINKSNFIQFGQGYTKEASAGKITYGAFDGLENGSLNIVGGGKDGQVRRVRVWDALQIGGWTIQEEGDQLVFKRGNAGMNDNEPNIRMASDGNLWVSRASGRGWVADSIGDLRNNVVRKDRNYEIVSQNGKCLDAGANNQGCEFTNDWRRFQFKQIQGVGPELANPKY